MMTGFAPTCATKCMRTLSLRARGNLGVDYACGGKRSGAKVMAMRAKRFRVKITFLKRLRQAGGKVARLAVPSLICGADVTGMPTAQLNEARLIARRTLADEVQRLRFSCGSVGRAMGPCALDDENLAGSIVETGLRDCINPWKLVNGPASTVVAWVVLSGTVFGTHNGF